MDLDSQVARIQRDIKSYETKIILFASLRFHLLNKGLQAFVEYKVQRSSSGEHVPDIFVIGNDHTFLEEKGSLPAKRELFDKAVQEIFGYEEEHDYEGIRFVPQVILMCPNDIFSSRRSGLASYRKKLTVVSYPFPVEDPIEFKLRQGIVRDNKLEGTLSGKVKVPQSRSWVPKIRFLRENPPTPYTAWYIWLAVWNFSSPSTINKDFSVEYNAILEHCRTFYPPWLSQESDQITQGRLAGALELLSYIGWIEFKEPLSRRTMILVHFGKGDRLRNETLGFLTKKYVHFALGRQTKIALRKARMPSAKSLRIKSSGMNERLDAFLKS